MDHYTKFVKLYPINHATTNKVLIKSRQLPSSIEGIARKLLLLYIGPYLVTQVKGNNTYEIKSINNNKIKGVYNQAEIKIYYEDG